jgi:hypothetical protein
MGDLKFSEVYPLLVKKVERKGRAGEEVDEVACWLTGYDKAGLEDHITRESNFTTFFAEAPRLHPKRSEIKGLICGYRVEDIEDPVEQQVRQLDKLVDELAKGKAMEKIKRG